MIKKSVKQKGSFLRALGLMENQIPKITFYNFINAGVVAFCFNMVLAFIMKNVLDAAMEIIIYV